MKFKKGDILSRTSYMIIESTAVNSKVRNDKNLTWEIANNILENESVSANFYEKEEKISRSAICDILENTNGTVFTVNFNKQADIKNVKNTLENLYPNKGKIASKDEFDKEVKAILKSINTGEERTLVGYLLSTKQEFGRYLVKDLEIVFNDNTAHAERQVDSKTINWLIYNKIKYIVK